jgi:hypothetical protein
MKIMGLGGLWREVKGLESLGVGHSRSNQNDPPVGGGPSPKTRPLDLRKIGLLKVTPQRPRWLAGNPPRREQQLLLLLKDAR